MKKISARVEDRSTQDEIKDAAAAYAGSFFVVLSDVKFLEELLQELHGAYENLLFIVIAAL